MQFHHTKDLDRKQKSETRNTYTSNKFTRMKNIIFRFNTHYLSFVFFFCFLYPFMIIHLLADGLLVGTQ